MSPAPVPAPAPAPGEKPEIVPAEKCSTMAQVRAAIDDLDEQIVTLLGRRLRYIEAASRIKANRAVVRDTWRKNDVIEKAVRKGQDPAVRMPEKIVRRVYEELVEGSIAWEFERWDERTGEGDGTEGSGPTEERA